MLTTTREESPQDSSTAQPAGSPLPAAARRLVLRNPRPHSGVDLLEFTQTALHDIRGSLFVAAEFSRLLADGVYGDLTPEQQRVLQLIHDRAYSVSDVLESLHVAVKLREQALDFIPRQCSVQDLLELTFPRLLGRVSTKPREIYTNVEGSPALMQCDRDAASLMLVNLFGHAAARLEAGTSITLHVEELQTEAFNMFRFTVEGDAPAPAAGQPAAPAPSLPKRHHEGSAYLALATAIAAETNCRIEGGDPERAQVAGLAIPTISEHASSSSDSSDRRPM